jgi:DNA-directed RNA polymerase subunit RPC12/RpoP
MTVECAICKKGRLEKVRTTFRGTELDAYRCTNCKEEFFDSTQAQEVLQKHKMNELNKRKANESEVCMHNDFVCKNSRMHDFPSLKKNAKCKSCGKTVEDVMGEKDELGAKP